MAKKPLDLNDLDATLPAKVQRRATTHRNSPDPPTQKRRGPRATAPELLAIPAIKTLRETLFAARVAAGTTDVTQAEVDQGAEALLRAGLPPYPTLVGFVVGGSLTTVGTKLRDWWRRVSPRFRDPNTPVPSPETKLDQQLRLLVSQLEATLREKLQGATDPLQALIAAAQLGEQQGAKAQLESATADRDRLRQQLEAMTFKVAELEAQLKAHAVTRLTEQSALEVGLERLHGSLEHLSAQLAPSPQASVADLDQLTTQVRRLITGLARSQRSPRPPARARASKPQDRSHKQPARTPRNRTRPTMRNKPASKGIRKRTARSPRRALPRRARHSR